MMSANKVAPSGRSPKRAETPQRGKPTEVPLATVSIRWRATDYFTALGAEDTLTLTGSQIAVILQYVHAACPNVSYFLDRGNVSDLAAQVQAVGELCHAIENGDKEYDHERVLWVLNKILCDLGARLYAIGAADDRRDTLKDAVVTIGPAPSGETINGPKAVA